MRFNCSEIEIYDNLLDFYNSPKYERFIEKWSYRILSNIVQLPDIQNNDDIYTNILLFFIAFLHENFILEKEVTKNIDELPIKERKIAEKLLKSCI
ncbi:MAG: hypothetical protein KGD63_12595 [Candidatus Lokiarchaeota archaeon]|nr:hypothetical protein [Candidatus Lokiarchaeota archaeon]